MTVCSSGPAPRPTFIASRNDPASVSTIWKRDMSACMSNAHRTAPRAARRGRAPHAKTPIRASPANSAMLPPCWVIRSLIAANQRLRTPVNSSVPWLPERPSASLIGVNPATSANSTTASSGSPLASGMEPE